MALAMTRAISMSLVYVEGEILAILKRSNNDEYSHILIAFGHDVGFYQV